MVAEARASGPKVGDDLAITGFDYIPAARLVDPPLTTLRQPMSEVGRLLVELLVEQLEHRHTSSASVLVEPTLIVRESSGGDP